MADGEEELTYTRLGWPLPKDSEYDEDAKEVLIELEENEVSLFRALTDKNDPTLSARPRVQELQLRNLAGGVWFCNAVVVKKHTLPLIMTIGFDIIKITEVDDGEDEIEDEPIASVVAGHLIFHTDGNEYAVLWGAIRHDPEDDEDSPCAAHRPGPQRDGFHAEQRGSKVSPRRGNDQDR